MLEFLVSQNSSENPSFLSILLAVLSAFFLSSLIVITYELTTRDRSSNDNFLQSLALISIVAATVMQAIGDSLARGLGMLGALAIIRFRTRLDNPRNMTFIFASLAVGISCGVYGFTIAFVGTIIFCLAAVLLRFTRFSGSTDLPADLRIASDLAGDDILRLERLLTKYCRQWSINQYRVEEKATGQEQIPGQLTEVSYQLAFKRKKDATALLEELKSMGSLQNIRFRFNSTDTEF